MKRKIYFTPPDEKEETIINCGCSKSSKITCERAEKCLQESKQGDDTDTVKSAVGLKDLNEDEMRYLLTFLPIQSRKNLRCVSKNVCFTVTQLDRAFKLIDLRFYNNIDVERLMTSDYKYFLNSQFEVNLRLPQRRGKEEDFINEFNYKVVNLSIESNGIKTKALHKLTNLRSIEIDDTCEVLSFYEGVDRFFSLMQSNCTNLKIIIFRNVNMFALDQENLPKVPNLTELTLSNCTGSGIIFLNQNAPYIKKLDIENMTDLTFLGSLQVEASRLSSLSVVHNNFHHYNENNKQFTCTPGLAHFLGYAPKLTSLTFSNLKISEEPTVLKDMLNVTSIEIQNCSGVIFQSVIKAAKYIKNLALNRIDYFYESITSDLNTLETLKINECSRLIVPTNVKSMSISCYFDKGIHIQTAAFASLKNITFNWCSGETFYTFFTNHFPHLEEVDAENVDLNTIQEIVHPIPLPSLKKIRGDVSCVRSLLKAPALNVEAISFCDELDPPTVDILKTMKNRIKSFEIKDNEKMGMRNCANKDMDYEEFIIDDYLLKEVLMYQTHSLTELILVQVELKEADFNFTLSSLQKLVLTQCTSPNNDALVNLIRVSSKSLRELVLEIDHYLTNSISRGYKIPSAPEIDFDFYKLNCTLPELRKVTIKDFDAETDSEDYIIDSLSFLLVCCGPKLHYLNLEYPLKYLLKLNWSFPKLTMLVLGLKPTDDHLIDIKKRIPHDATILIEKGHDF